MIPFPLPPHHTYTYISFLCSQVGGFVDVAPPLEEEQGFEEDCGVGYSFFCVVFCFPIIGIIRETYYSVFVPQTGALFLPFCSSISCYCWWMVVLFLFFRTCDSSYEENYPNSHEPMIIKRVADDDYCKHNRTYVWCLPQDYNQEKHPFTCKCFVLSGLPSKTHLSPPSDSNLINKKLPWNYDFKFVVEEISNVNDKAQVSLCLNPDTKREHLLYLRYDSRSSLAVSYLTNWIKLGVCVLSLRATYSHGTSSMWCVLSRKVRYASDKIKNPIWNNFAHKSLRTFFYVTQFLFGKTQSTKTKSI